MARAGQILVSSAFTEEFSTTDFQNSIQIQNETGSVKTNIINDEEFVPEGTIFSGLIHSRIPTNTVEDMALRLSLLSIRNIGSETSQGWGACEVQISDEDTQTEILYDFDSTTKPSLCLESTRIWVPSFEDELVKYFSKNPEEM